MPTASRRLACYRWQALIQQWYGTPVLLFPGTDWQLWGQAGIWQQTWGCQVLCQGPWLARLVSGWLVVSIDCLIRQDSVKFLDLTC